MFVSNTLVCSKTLDKSIYWTSAFDCVDSDKLWKVLREMDIPGHLTCLLRNLCAGQKATVRTLWGTPAWFTIEKGVDRAVCCHPVCLTCTLST